MAKGKLLKEVKITAKRPKRDTTSVTKSGEVPNRKIDSLKKVGYGKAIGAGYVGKGGKRTYGPEASDAIKAGLTKKKTK